MQLKTPQSIEFIRSEMEIMLFYLNSAKTELLCFDG